MDQRCTPQASANRYPYGTGNAPGPSFPLKGTPKQGGRPRTGYPLMDPHITPAYSADSPQGIKDAADSHAYDLICQKFESVKDTNQKGKVRIGSSSRAAATGQRSSGRTKGNAALRAIVAAGPLPPAAKPQPTKPPPAAKIAGLGVPIARQSRWHIKKKPDPLAGIPAEQWIKLGHANASGQVRLRPHPGAQKCP